MRYCSHADLKAYVDRVQRVHHEFVSVQMGLGKTLQVIRYGCCNVVPEANVITACWFTCCDHAGDCASGIFEGGAQRAGASHGGHTGVTHRELVRNSLLCQRSMTAYALHVPP